MPLHAFCCASLYTLKVFIGDKYRAIFFPIEWQKQGIMFYGIEVSECPLTLSGFYYITIV